MPVTAARKQYRRNSQGRDRFTHLPTVVVRVILANRWYFSISKTVNKRSREGVKTFFKLFEGMASFQHYLFTLDLR